MSTRTRKAAAPTLRPMTLAEARNVRLTFGDPRSIEAADLLHLRNQIEVGSSAVGLDVACGSCNRSGNCECDCGNIHSCRTCRGTGRVEILGNGLEDLTHRQLREIFNAQEAAREALVEEA